MTATAPQPPTSPSPARDVDPDGWLYMATARVALSMEVGGHVSALRLVATGWTRDTHPEIAAEMADVAVCAAIVAETGEHIAVRDIREAPITAIGDSLALLLVVLALENALAVDLGDEVMRATTVGGLAREVERAMGRRS